MIHPLDAREYLSWDAARPDRHQRQVGAFLSAGLDGDGGLLLPGEAKPRSGVGDVEALELRVDAVEVVGVGSQEVLDPRVVLRRSGRPPVAAMADHDVRGAKRPPL